MRMTAVDQPLLPLYQQGRHHEVVAESQRLGVVPETQPLEARILAASLFQLGEYGQAATLLGALEAPMGHDADYLSLYGATCRRLGLLQQAEQLLHRALQVSPASAPVRNNYANVLIDLGRGDEARTLLEQLLREQPDYQDARQNLNRLQFRQQPPAPAPQAPPSAPAAEPQPSWSPADPLMLAFSEEEVKLAGGVANGSRSSAGSQVAQSLQDPQQQQMAAEQLELADRAVKEGNNAFALQLCGQALAGIGANAKLYITASDAYIGLQRFREAEICLLQSIAIAEPSINQLINLVSLASMRGDLALSDHYLDRAAGLDPSNPNLATLRRNVDNRRRALQAKPYRFEPSWPEQQPMKKQANS